MHDHDSLPSSPRLQRALFFVLFLAVAVGGATAQKELLYHVDFDDHLVGQLPVVGAEPAPSSVVSLVAFGDPTVVAGHGPLVHQPCRFGNGTTGYDQIHLIVEDYVYAPRPPYLSYERFSCEFDLFVDHLVGTFVLFLSGIGVHSITFHADGSLTAWTQYGQVDLGDYAIGALVHVKVDVDLRPGVQTLTFALDGAPGQVLPAHTITPVPAKLRRMHWNLPGVDAAESVSIDDIRVFGAGGNPALDLGYASAGGADLSLSYGSVGSLDLHLATPGWPAALVISAGMTPLPVFGGTLVPDLTIGSLITVWADANGSYWSTVPYGSPASVLYLQAATLQIPTLQFVFSNAIEVHI